MKSKHKPSNALPEPYDVLYRIKRGLAGYVSYLAACEMNKAFSEYVLYEPILRILMARGYIVDSEVMCPGIQQPKVGDKKKLDFVAAQNGDTLAIEIKWPQKRKPDFENDLLKLAACLKENPKWRGFLCVFGKKSMISNLQIPASLKEQGRAVEANFGKTRFGCRIFEYHAE